MKRKDLKQILELNKSDYKEIINAIMRLHKIDVEKHKKSLNDKNAEIAHGLETIASLQQLAKENEFLKKDIIHIKDEYTKKKQAIINVLLANDFKLSAYEINENFSKDQISFE